MTILEVCIDTIEGARAAIAGGAHRLELCRRLDLDGLSPTLEVVDEVVSFSPIPVMVMVRPEPGEFHPSPGERRAMLDEIEALQDRGVAGVVVGALDDRGELDTAFLEKLLERAGSLDFTHHRAFDRLPDVARGLDQLIELGIPRVLTSGGEPTIAGGQARLEALLHQAAGRIQILPGGGLGESLIPSLVAAGFTELHGSASRVGRTDEERVRAFVAAL